MMLNNFQPRFKTAEDALNYLHGKSATGAVFEFLPDGRPNPEWHHPPEVLPFEVKWIFHPEYFKRQLP